ncbi:MAG: PilZ domain-containing protein [Oligoflexia bacterium]|nr:PilZ domain-containing protein [Oligoflexia bacterium]
MSDKSKYTFLLFRQESEGCDQIVAEIGANPLCQIIQVDTIREIFDHAADGSANSLIFNLKIFDSNTLKVIQKIKSITPTLSTTIVTAQKIQNIDMQKLKKYNEIVIIDKPVKHGDFALLTERLAEGKPIYFREHKRFNTIQIAHLEKLTSNEQYEGSVYTISKGGAYIELTKGNVKPGELFRVSIKLDQLSKAHNFNAEVIWTAPKVRQGLAVGLKFINEEQVYRTLLEKV